MKVYSRIFDCVLLWPSHRLPTINTSRYTYFHDRVDLLLADLQTDVLWSAGIIIKDLS